MYQTRATVRKRPTLIQRGRAQTHSTAAPTGGWNARDALGAMDELDAVILDNWFPGTTSCELRLGYSRHVTGLGGQVESLMAYAGGTTNKLKAATSGSVFDVTDTGAVGAAELSSMTNGRWQHVNFTTTGGSYLCMVNGADAYRVYDGSAWHKHGDGAPYDITGVTSTTLIGINVFKNRLWFIQTGTLKAWYLPVNSIGGAAASLDMSSLCSRGGYLMAMGTWTLDAGYGADDYAVWITSRGQVLVWRMTDPTDANSIFLIGVWDIGSPIGRRCFFKLAGDLLLITRDGLVPLSAALKSTRFDPRIAVSDKIQREMGSAVDLYGANFGWQVCHLPRADQLYLNVPISSGNQQQYVMNTINRSWCRFKGYSANCFEIFEDDLYYGSNGLVCKAWDTNTDAGQAIHAIGLQAFSYYKNATALKRATMMRPMFYVQGEPEIQAGINYDFDTTLITSPIAVTPTIYAKWDQAVWGDAIWGGEPELQKLWQGTVGSGYALAPLVAAVTNGDSVQWVATDVVYEQGGIL